MAPRQTVLALSLAFSAFTVLFFFFFNDTATTEIYTLSLHDALPICNVVQFDVFLEGIVVRADQRRRVEHDLGDHDRSETRPGVGPTQRVGVLGHKVFLVDAGEVAAEGDAVLRRSESEPVKIAGQIGPRVAGKQPDLVAERTERKARGRTAVEIAFGYDAVSARRNGRGIEAIFFRVMKIVGEEPAADIGR